MSSLGEIGEVKVTERSGAGTSIEWRIPDFLSLDGKAGDKYRSTVFNCCDEKWILRICPRGLWPIASSDWPRSEDVCVFLSRFYHGLPKPFKITIGLLGAEGLKNKCERRQVFSKDDKVCGWLTICYRGLLEYYQSQLMQGGTLVLAMDLESDEPTLCRDTSTQTEETDGDDVATGGNQSLEIQSIKKAVEDMGKLFASGEKSDITVEVKEAEFKVHSFILSARSPVLSAMLEHDTAERASNKIRIDDCEPDVFQQFLEYLYTGSVQSLTAHTVFGLYTVADKYLADDLKLLCIEHIPNTLCIQTFCDTIKFALTHRLDSLFQLAIDFASKNFQSIVMSLEWQSFICEHPREANELLIKCFGPQR